LSETDKRELLRMMEAQVENNEKGRLLRLYEAMYPWQLRFNKATSENLASLLMAANQCVSGHTPILVKQGTVEKWLPLVETLSLPDVRVRSWADGSLHDADIAGAYFQGILPTYRLYLSNGHHLDCSGEHRVLDGEGNYRTILSLVSDLDALSYYQTGEDSRARCDEGDCLYGQPLPPGLNIAPALLPLLDDALQHIQNPRLSPQDAAEHTDQYNQAFQSADLLSNGGARNHAEGLIDKFSSCSELPPSGLMLGLLQVSELLHDESASPLRSWTSIGSCRIYGYGAAYSNRIYFPRPISLVGDVSIIAFQGIGLQPCFDYKIPDYHNYISAGVVSHNCGKTRTGCIIDAYHLTGNYPEGWEGHKFKRPPLCWLLGHSGEKTRDLLQQKLFGRLKDGEFEGGFISADLIVDYKSMTGTSGACREVRVKHANGISICQFWSYSQGQHALMGDVVDWYHIDEEPKDQTIYPQVMTRTLNGDKGAGGRGILTLTPENGKTDLVCGFMDDPTDGQYMQTATWDDAPHLDETTKEQILSAYPPYQRDMRSKGIPLMGSGLIYPVSQDSISIEPFKIPDYWFVINGMDFGWNHPQAHVQLVWDRDNDMYYITNAWKGKEKQPFEAWHVVKPWAADIPTAWPHDGLQHEKGSAKQQKEYYEEEGWMMLAEHATWPDGSNGVWAGIIEIINLMDTGRFKVFSNLFDVFEEIREYHTKTTPSGDVLIVKTKDDILDSIRYAYMMRRYAIRICDINQQYQDTNRNTVTAGNYDNF